MIPLYFIYEMHILHDYTSITWIWINDGLDEVRNGKRGDFVKYLNTVLLSANRDVWSFEPHERETVVFEHKG